MLSNLDCIKSDAFATIDFSHYQRDTFMHRESADVIDHHCTPFNCYRDKMLAYFVTGGEYGDIYRIKGMGRKLFKLDLPMIDKQLLPYRSIGGKRMD